MLCYANVYINEEICFAFGIKGCQPLSNFYEVFRKTLNLFSLQWVVILLCSIHCVIVDYCLFSGNVLILVPGHEMPYRARLSTFIDLWEDAGETVKPVGCICNSFCCGGRNLLSLWQTGATTVVQISVPGCVIQPRPMEEAWVTEVCWPGKASWVQLATRESTVHGCCLVRVL